jgi:hypothetical protein
MTFPGPICVCAVVYNESDYSTPGERGFGGA